MNNPSSFTARAAGSAPVGFAAALFGRTAQEDLQVYDARGLALLAESAWRHIAEPREAGRPALRIVEPDRADQHLGQISVLEVVNDDMPFLLDSTLAELADAGIELRLVAHPVFAVERDEAGRLLRIELDPAAAPDAPRESLIHIHVGRLAAEEQRAALTRALETTYAEVRVAVEDREAMLERVTSAVQALRDEPPALAADEIAEAVQFMQWIMADNFVFLGQRTYRFEDVASDVAPLFEPVENSGLGILRDPDVKVLRRDRELVTVTPEVIEFLRDDHVLIVAKANVKSRVHRHVHMDYIGVKRFDDNGRPIGELRIVGLFTASAYTQSTQIIPYIRHKSARVIANARLDPTGHFGRVLAETLETYPRDELFQVDVATLTRFASEIATLQERPRLRILVRVDRFDRFASVLAFLPRDRFDTQVQTRLGEELARIYDGRVSATYPFYPEGPLVRVHYIIGRDGGRTPAPSRESVEEAAAAIVRTWSDALRARILALYGAAGHALATQWASAFSAGYMETFDPGEALDDIALAQRMTDARPYSVSLRRSGDDVRLANFEVFSRGRPMPLSERAPVLEAMGFEVINERTFEIAESGATQQIWIHDMALKRASGEAIDIERRGASIEGAAMAVFQGDAESDGYNALVIEAGLGWRDVAVLRTFSRYLRQAGVTWSQSYMWRTASRNAAIVERLLALFAVRFDPHLGLTDCERADRQAGVVVEIETLLRRVSSLDEDRILRRFLNLLLAAVRTNFFQTDAKGQPRSVISFKFESRRIDDLPLPRPLYEITVCSPRVEGVHLRFGKVARGGIRWSDRPQDFRTEILGLVKAQQVKNAVIVPVGAKGGFVAKMISSPSRPEERMAEGVAAYRLFVGALLDISDNIVGDQIEAPADAMRWDGDDPYLVVAADKGTSTFSDIANGVAADHGFWLDDAFASGGSAGYDHKKMGITARGAWEAVKRHFREMDIDIQTTPFTVVGVGDMSGDVFGNAMLLSPATMLVAAFDHRDIFIDPNPDMARALSERRRLFELPGSSWQDYNRAAISTGGGVYSRSNKSVSLSAQAQALLGLPRAEATPDDVLSAVLRVQADLLWFGGIGTYVRASDEFNEQVGDRANDSIRIAATDLRCKAIGEGANLGLTQRARIEVSRRGVRLNTDAIDNSAGVNTSDIEVNIKIALSQPVRAGSLDRPARDAMLAEMTDEVAALVLRNTYQQTLAISLAERRGADESGFTIRLMQQLEAHGRLERTVEFLPSDAELVQRAKAGVGLTRPEIAVLLAYAKLALHDELLASDVPDDPYLGQELARYFPTVLSSRFPAPVAGHRLRREIVATQLANALVNRGGPAIIARLADETGARAPEIVRAFAVARDAFSLSDLHSEVDALDSKISGAAQLGLYASIQDLLLSRLAWFVRNVEFTTGLESVAMRFKAGVKSLETSFTQAAPPSVRQAIAQQTQAFEQSGAPTALAQKIASLGALAAACDVVLIAEQARRSLPDVAAAFFAADQAFGVSALSEAARRIPAGDYYERLALDRTIESLEQSLRRLAGKIVRASDRSGEHAVAAWFAVRGADAIRIRDALGAIFSGGLTLPRAVVAGSLLVELVGE